MKRPLLISVISSIVLAAACWTANAAPRTSSRSTARAVESWVVVQIGDEFKVLEKSRVDDEQKDLKKKYDEKMKEWQDLRKSDPDVERPVRLILKMVKTGFKTQKGADEYRDMMEEKEGKGDKKSGPFAHDR